MNEYCYNTLITALNKEIQTLEDIKKDADCKIDQLCETINWVKNQYWKETEKYDWQPQRLGDQKESEVGE